MSQIDGVQGDAEQRLALKLAAGDYALPVEGVGGEAALVVVTAGVVEVCGRRVSIQLHGLVVVGRLPAYGVVLEDEVAEAVHDGSVFVNLDAARYVGTVSDEHVRAFVDAGVREVHQELGRLVAVRAALVAVYGDHHPIRHAPRIPHPLDVVRQIASIELGADTELLAESEDLVQEDEACVAVV